MLTIGKESKTLINDTKYILIKLQNHTKRQKFVPKTSRNPGVLRLKDILAN